MPVTEKAISLAKKVRHKISIGKCNECGIEIIVSDMMKKMVDSGDIDPTCEKCCMDYLGLKPDGN